MATDTEEADPEAGQVQRDVTWRVDFWCQDCAVPCWMTYRDGRFEDETEARDAYERASDDHVRLVKVTEETVEKRAM